MSSRRLRRTNVVLQSSELPNMQCTHLHSTILEIVQKYVQSLAFNTVLLNDDAATPNDLSWVALLVDFAQTGPGSQDLSITDFDEVDFVFGAQGLDEFDVFCFGTSFNEYAEMGLAFIQGLGTLAEPTSETVVHKCVLQDLLLRIN